MLFIILLCNIRTLLVLVFSIHSNSDIDFLEAPIPFNLIKIQFVSQMPCIGCEAVSSKAGIDAYTENRVVRNQRAPSHHVVAL